LNQPETQDVVIIGGGIGGTALAGYLARGGLSVLVLEQLETFSDRVRGEWMAPWGVAEAKRLGLYEPFIAAGGHHLTHSIGYDEALPPEAAEATQLDLAQFVDGIPGPLSLEHVTLQNVALEAARQAGATVLRGTSRLEFSAGEEPRVSFRHDGRDHVTGCRWLVGADGRTSNVRRQLGITLHEDPLDHLIVGLLLDGAHGWPEDRQCIGKFGDIHYLVFPQGKGKVRIYADYAYHGHARFNGENGARELLQAFDLPGVPHSDAVARGRPIGPCRSYPSQDAWVDVPVAPGVVLIGDAAGYNDPILGQGLSVTLRDARMVGDALLANREWQTSMFDGYVSERRERLRRLRIAARVATTAFARFEPEDLARRARIFQRLAANPANGLIMTTAFAGPENIPDRYFSEEFLDGFLA
jgi:2-polyprenyl-6-methoxyphenol hydroxylase-like FAD-dependent oxidoreductase